MSCNCGGGCHGCQQHSYAVAHISPWQCNQFGQIPPTIPCTPGPGTGGGCSLRDANLACIANQVSTAFYALHSSVIEFVDQIGVLETQKIVLLTAMKEKKEYTCDVDKIFDRDETVNGIINAITESIELLEDEDDYETIDGHLKALTLSIRRYFQMAATWM